jgi:hypothetical protein
MAEEIEVRNTLEDAHQLAVQITDFWMRWDGVRSSWLTARAELRSYLFATDTTQTTNSNLPWKNKTTLPKLVQIRDNLHANYVSALFPNEDWLAWEGSDDEAVTKDKKKAIEGYMRTKLRNSDFKFQINQLLYDYIDAGNAFGIVQYERDIVEKTDPVLQQIDRYTGPRLIRISPQDIVFNPLAVNFAASPKIIRSIKTLAELLKEIDKRPDIEYDKEVVKRILDNRQAYAKQDNTATGDSNKSAGMRIDGFGSLEDYYSSGFVECLTFYGDIYDIVENKLWKDCIVTVVDRSYILMKKENPSWFGRAPIHHVGWRHRDDNLWSMGPLDNLVGMQYRIDHLENLKADVYDMIAFPVLKIKGDVEDFNYGPNERIYVHDEGDVEFMHPDVTALQADMQIATLEQKMEEFAGAPKEAMGIRSPGEKTAYEVDQLMTAAGRIFQTKITAFEEFMEGCINDMLETSRRNLDVADVARIVDDDVGVVEFLSISRDDLTAKGRLMPVGARHFAAKARMVQQLTAFANSPIGQDPAVSVHISGLALAKLFEDVLDVEKFKLVSKNIRVMEQFETQQMMNSAQEQMATEDAMPVEESPGELGMTNGGPAPIGPGTPAP